jgi:thiol-disulfide isomerase/thioredoxin
MLQWYTQERMKYMANKLKPWFLYFGLFLVLHYTGAFSAIATFTHAVLLETGAKNVGTSPTLSQEFDYNFTLFDLQKNRVDVNQFRGKTMFINVWATWCGPCRVEMPSIQKLYEKVGHDNIVFIMLSLDQKDAFDKVAAFIHEKKYTFPVYLAAGGLPAPLQVRSIPVTYVIDPQGKIVRKEVGAMNYDTEKFKRFIESL